MARYGSNSTVERRARAPGCGKDLLARRIVNDRVLHPALDLHTDRNAERRESVHEVGRAVQRVDDPDGVRFTNAAGFLAEDGVIRIVLVHDLDDDRLRLAISLGYEIVVSLDLDLELLEVDLISHQRVAGAARRHHRHV